ncbi:MAG: hypothetical protein Q4D87_05695 [Actinomycetaceae bacterium]|nr:hypothetical protein [Actinomycetaceae bacterium]
MEDYEFEAFMGIPGLEYSEEALEVIRYVFEEYEAEHKYRRDDGTDCEWEYELRFPEFASGVVGVAEGVVTLENIKKEWADAHQKLMYKQAELVGAVRASHAMGMSVADIRQKTGLLEWVIEQWLERAFD